VGTCQDECRNYGTYTERKMNNVLTVRLTLNSGGKEYVQEHAITRRILDGTVDEGYVGGIVEVMWSEIKRTVIEDAK